MKINILNLRVVLALSLCSSLAACGVEDEAQPSIDPATDAGLQADTATPVDAGVDGGAPSNPDAGAPETDAGVREDASGDPDSASPDAGSATDTGSAPDSGVPDAEADAGADAEGSADCDPLATAQAAWSAGTGVAPDGLVTVVANEGRFTATIDASAGGPANAASHPWIYLSLTDGGQVALADVDAYTSNDWDLAFRRSNVRLNSGNSGPGPWMLTRVDGTSWETAALPGRTAVWTTDSFVDETCGLITEGRGTPATAFGIWYDYDPTVHSVVPTPGTVWFMYRMDTHQVIRLQINSWSDGVFELQWAAEGR